tara:strand:- start:1370 stop:1666 length:297 start_codon:yes stop_codon:yes gene_type:complete
MALNWNNEELEAVVRSYLDMKNKELKGIKFTKVSYYRKLSKKFGRSEKSYEMRMRNISFVYYHKGKDWLIGLKPLRHVGSNVFAKIEEIIEKIEKEKY